ncbi:glycosyltransferase [Microbacterium sp. zg.Y625]|uniref:glycosyltransferase n=1 Tax=Microbacterium jiangjiandongii TaxID=3049071 RepID=UPI00214BBFF1|nr:MULTISPECIES: glycosyltransferase [unclassified Microbacterium]MCR2793743.1 glycosyltransferase [Microbacterium sp. zg.Y625]WIM26088.1 glycosyltransferase [Microbacterium sp. zg-Y625]
MRSAVRDARVERSYSRNTAGEVTSPAMREWFRAHGRPVSIVIPSYNDVALLTVALRSIEETLSGADYEVIIVDDYIDAAVGAQLRAFESDRVRVILKERRLGFAGTVNVGMAQARHDIVLLNSDIVAKPGWLEALQYSAYEIDPRIGMVSPKLVYPDGLIQYGGTYWARLLAPQWFGHLHVGSPATKPTANVAGYNTSISGACVYITRAAFDAVGPLDDEFWLGFEDVDYGLRSWDAGFRCYYQPAAMLVHHESASRGYSQGHRELASMRRFWRRWQSRFLARSVDAAQPVDIVLGSASDGLWRRYVETLADHLRRSGREVAVHVVEGPAPQEELIERLAGRGGVVVACDWTAAETVWLATRRAGVPVYLLPTVESVGFPDDPARQTRIIAGYRSEFDYIAPTRWAQRQLQAETAWEVLARVAPALQPPALPESAEPVVVSIGATAQQQGEVGAVAAKHDHRVVHVDALDTGELERIAGLRPRAIVSYEEYSSPLAPYALMSLGAVWIAAESPALGHDVLDGYNALLFSRGDAQSLERAMADALTHDATWAQVRANAHAWVQRAARLAPDAVSRAIDAFATDPVS